MQIFVRQSPAMAGEWRSADEVGLMLATAYDPGRRAADVFSAENMVDGNSLVVMTAVERETLSVVSLPAGDVVIRIPNGGAKVVIENTAGNPIAEFRGADRSVHLKNAVVVDL